MIWDTAYWSYGSVNCTTPDVAAGYHNLTVSLRDPTLGFGNAMATPYLYRAKGSMDDLVHFGVFDQLMFAGSATLIACGTDCLSAA